MRIWIFKDGETLPLNREARRMRAGRLASALVRRGHEVVWWSSTFCHQTKSLLFHEDTDFDVEPGFQLRLLHSGRYSRNFSFRRFYHHSVLARRLATQLRRYAPPDAIVTAFPIIDVTYAVTQYALPRQLPVVVDVRDLWPDTFIDEFPRFLKQLGRVVLFRQFSKTRAALERAVSLVAISQGCLDWALNYASRPQKEHDAVFYTAYPKLISGGAPSPLVRQLKQSVRDKITFVFVGSFGRSYELQLICDVAENIQRAGHTSIHFVLAGNGEQYESISERVNGMGNVTMTGWLSEADLRGVLSLSHVGLVACKLVDDAMPNKVAEYLSADLPLLSSLRGEMEYLIDTTGVGYSYPCGDRKRLTELVLRLAYDESLRLSQSKNARALFMRYFCADSVYEQYADHVERVAKLHAEVGIKSEIRSTPALGAAAQP
jgi:glycosyltransferase involved in cell wall biosynthesis